MIFCEHCEYPITDRDKGCTNPDCPKNKLGKCIGERIVDAIIEGRLVRAECPDSPESGCLLVWSANVYEQLSKLVNDYARG